MMNFRQAIALSLSADLHQVAKTVRDADYVLRDAATALRGLLVEIPGERQRDRLAVRLTEILEDVVEAQTLVVQARSDLTGRGPESLLKDDPNRG